MTESMWMNKILNAIGEICEKAEKVLENLVSQTKETVEIAAYFEKIRRLAVNESLMEEIEKYINSSEMDLKQNKKSLENASKEFLNDEDAVFTLQIKKIEQWLEIICNILKRNEGVIYVVDLNRIVESVQMCKTILSLLEGQYYVEEVCLSDLVRSHIGIYSECKPNFREPCFLKFDYINDVDDCPDETGEIFKFSVPQRIVQMGPSRVLERIVPSVMIAYASGEKQFRSLSSEPTSVSELVDMKAELERHLNEANCPKNGISEERTEIYLNLFDELIRQVTVEHGPEAGELLLDIKDHSWEKILYNRTLVELSKSYVYRQQFISTVRQKDPEIASLQEEMERILKQQKELVEEMKCIEKGFVSRQKSLFNKMAKKRKEYREQFEFLVFTMEWDLARIEDFINQEDNVRSIEHLKKMNQIAEMRKKKQEEEKNKEEEVVVEEAEEASAKEESVEEEEEGGGEGGEAGDEVKLTGRKAWLMEQDLVYRSEDEEDFKESTSEGGGDGESSRISVMSFAQKLDPDLDRATYLFVQAVDDNADVTLSDTEKGEVKPPKKPEEISVIIPEKEESMKEPSAEEVVVVEEVEAEEEEEVQKVVRRKKTRKSEILENLEDEETKPKPKKEDKKKAKAEEKKDDRASVQAKEEKKEVVGGEEKEDKFDYGEIEFEEMEVEGEPLEVLELPYDEEIEEEMKEEEDVYTTSSPSESEEEVVTKPKKGEPGAKDKKKSQGRTELLPEEKKALVDVELGDTDQSDFDQDIDEEAHTESS